MTVQICVTQQKRQLRMSKWWQKSHCYVKKSCKLHYRSISVWKNVVTICWNFNQCRGNSTWTVVFQLCLCCYHGPVPQHPFHSPNKSASKMLLAQTWLANWYLMCGPHGNSGSDDLNERGSLSLSPFAWWPLQETSSQRTARVTPLTPSANYSPCDPHQENKRSVSQYVVINMHAQP